MTDLEIGVLGAGVMGSGIAQTLAQAGYSVICADPDENAVEQARQSTLSGRYGLERAVARGKLGAAEAAATEARLHFASELEALVDCRLVVECVPERLDLKIRIFRDLDSLNRRTRASRTDRLRFLLAYAGGSRVNRRIARRWRRLARRFDSRS